MPIAPELCDAGAALRAALGPVASQLRWVDRDGLHLTLRFLGEIAPAEVERAVDAARAAAASAAPFSIALTGAGAFPSLREPRVLWVGISEGAAPLVTLARSLEAALVARRFPVEARPFQPHLTVARARSAGRPPDLRAQASTLFAPDAPVIGVQRVEAIVVVESTLGPRGPAYREVSRGALGGR